NLINAWRTPDLRKKLLLTAAMLAIYRLGSYIPAPGVNSDALPSALSSQGGIFGLLSVFSGGGLARLGVVGLGIMPFITASITQRGVGNGMSLLIFASILTSAPAGISAWWNGSTFEKLSLPIVVFGVIVAVVYVQEGIRKIPIQYAKRMVGRRMTTGGSTYLP